MKRSTLIRLIAIVLVISMVAAPVSAAGTNAAANESNGLGGLIEIIIEIIRNIFDGWFGQDDSAETAEPAAPADPGTSTEPGAAAPGETAPEAENAVYEQNQSEGGQNADVDLSATGNTPVTMGNVSMGLNALDTVSNVETETVNVNCGFINWVDGGQYYIQNARAAKSVSGASYLKGATDGITGVALENATLWTLHIVDETTFQLFTEIDGTTYYMAIDSTGDDGESLTTTPTNLTITFCNDTTDYVDGDGNQLQICGVKYLNQSGSTGTTYRGEESSHDSGSAMWFYLVEGETLTKVTVAATDSSRDIPVSVLTATAGDSQSGQGPDNALDSNNDTLWHTNWYGNSRDNHWIQFQLSEDYNVDGLRYLPRQSDGSNGTITQYQIQVSDDGVTFRTIASGTWENSTSWKLASFSAENVKYVRLVALDAVSDNSYVFASAAEIRLTGVKNTTTDSEDEAATVVYFPVTMYDYHTNELNVAIHIEELEQARENGTEITEWNGLYFSGGTPGAGYTGPTGEYEEVTMHTVTYELVTPELSDDGGINLNGEDLYILVNKRSGRAVALGDCQRPNGKADAQDNLHLVDSPDLGLGTNLSSAPESFTVTYTAETADSLHWNYYTDDTYRYFKAQNGEYMDYTTSSSGTTTDTSREQTHQSFEALTSDANAVLIKQGYGNYLSDFYGHDGDYYCAYGTADAGGYFYIYKRVSFETGTEQVPVTDSFDQGYAAHNSWHKNTGEPVNGDLFYTGLVASQMVDDQIVFNIADGGIFNNVDDDTKNVYQYVGLPFELKEYTEENSEDNKLGFYYSFDSDENGTYFAAAPQSGTGPEDGQMHKLRFAEGAPQPMPSGLSVGDGSTNAFLPYNSEWTPQDDGSGQYTNDIDYHFGMRADLPFAMTTNGRIKSTDDESTPITFTFSGDDDVWVFIDGHLVIDLGGIHNRLDATIDFANNTITYSEHNIADSKNGLDENNETGSFNDPDFATTQKLFTDAEGVGVIPMSREAFALNPNHEMHVFYLERGEGTSNARIEFNLPMNDTVIVTKDATQSWSQAAEDADKNNNAPDPDSWGLEPLTAKEQSSVNNIPFGFTLYKKLAGSEDFVPVANTSFYLVGRGVEGTVIDHTDANGHFYLKNGQSAKFITDLPTEGVTYYVVEDQVPDGFVAPDFNFAGKAAYEYEWYDAGETLESGSVPGADASEIPEQIIPMPDWDEENKEWVADTWHVNKSYEVTVKGSVEKQDSIEFICSNFLNAALPNPTAIANEDIIVIDYGLPVQIDPLANDVFRGNEIEIVAWGDQTLTLNEVLDEYGNAVPHGTEGGTSWSGSQTFHSGTVTLTDVTYAEALSDDGNITSVTRDTFTYKLTEQLTEVEVIHYIIKVTSSSDVVADDNVVETKTACRYALAKVYICPATVMYYEENFSDLVTFTGSNWVGPVTTDGASDYQEPGVVGDPDNSVYGSDVAYQDDSYDSNGTSYYGDTSGVDSGLGKVSAIRFSYTFTGTGTTFFARTSANTGCMQIKLYEGTDTSGEYMNIYYRDTYWKDENNTNEDLGGTLHNIPVFTEEDLPYGTYTVVCTVAAAGTPTEGNVNGAGNKFYLDGIRIMQPLNGVFYTNDLGEQDWVPEEELAELTAKALDAYETDGESNMETLTLRNKLIDEYGFEGDPEAGETEEKWPFAVMTDVDGQIVYASDYESIGPKEEVYLLPGQSVSFAIKYWHREGYEMHMGMKAPFGTASVQVGQNTFALENAADCYFDITGMQASIVTETDEEGNEYFVATYTFTATDSIVSLTNIKVVGNYEFMLVDFENEDVSGDIGGNGDYEFEEEGNE